MTIVCFKGKGRQPWRWKLIARNGKAIADGAEGYATKSNLARAVQRLDRARLPRLPVVWR